MSRTPLIAGNWKMNKTPKEAAQLAKELRDAVPADSSVEVLACPPFTSIQAVQETLQGSAIAVGAQNVHWAESGAFTGEISAPMLAEMGVKHVIIGHSERRQYFGETDATVNQRLKAALEAGLVPLVCIGETLDQRDAGQVESVIRDQVTEDFADVTAEQMATTVVAYEPVWAIGTGRTATPEQAQEVHALIRQLLRNAFGEVAEAVRILYGGSMKPDNAAELLACGDIDGGLIGGASLKADDFAAIVKAATA
ncbi:MAG: triose-phosphate isomerase [Verrucomicrobiota bacterium]